MKPEHRSRLVGNCFDKLHEQLSTVRSHVEALGDPDAVRALAAMERGLLRPMRRLRRHLEIPYDWSA